MIDQILLNISLVFGLTILLAFIISWLRQPLIIAYILTGIVAGPLLFNLVENFQDFFGTFARLGVILLLFAVGLDLNLSYLKNIGRVAIITGVGQTIFTIIFAFLILFCLDFPLVPGLLLAVAMTFSSTIIILKLLHDKGDAESVYGRYTIGLMLVQDVIAIALLIVLPFIGASPEAISNQLFIMAGKTVLTIILLYPTTKYLLPSILKRIGTSGEFLFIFTIAWCMGIASLVHWAGLSWEIGAIVAGISLGSSIYHYEIASRVKPLRDFFIIIFFVILGSEMELAGLSSILLPGILLSLFVLIGSPIILYLLFRKLKFTRRNSFLAGVTAAQVSEFGFILLFLGKELGQISSRELNVFTFTALTTIFVSSYLICYNYQLYKIAKPIFKKFFGKDKINTVEEKALDYPVWLFGYHRMGWKISQGLSRSKLSFGVVDYNPQAVYKLRKRKIPAFFGDGADVEFLAELPLNKAKLIISTIPEYQDQIALLEHIRKINKKATVICNLYHTKYLDELYAAGANYVILPHLLGGEFLSRILRHKGWTKGTFAQLRRQQKEELKLQPENIPKGR